MRFVTMLCLAAMLVLPVPAVADDAAPWPAEVHKARVEVHAGADFQSATLATLKRNTRLTVLGQQGLWYRVALADGSNGYLRVNEVRIAARNPGKHDDTMHVLMTGKSGSGRVTETAGVRGLDESELRAASFDAAQLEAMQSHRVDADTAARYARKHGWTAIAFDWPDEAPKARKGSGGIGHVLSESRGLLGRLGSKLGGASKVAEAADTPSSADLDEEELALGPLIAGRVLGARPLWANAGAQHRVNVIGRWLASQTSRPDLPWTFGVIDTPEFNAFAAPGGYILVTRGLYELVDGDQELAAVLGHEITHVVQRDHYEVIRKQQMMAAAKQLASSQIHTGGGLAGSLARDYVEKNGAAILFTGLDRSAEYRADEIAEVYLVRAGMDPLALYAILQNMLAVGNASGGLAQLYKTHPSLDSRLDRLDRLDLGRGGRH